MCKEKLDKVIAGLRYCINPNTDCDVCDDDCPYLGKRDGHKVCVDFLMEDALTVIEALRTERDDLRKDIAVLTEPVEIEYPGEKSCSNCGCGEYIHEYEIYICRGCGDDCHWIPKGDV